jgi:hypothetical protein
MWCNYNSANGFDTDDTSTFFYMLKNVQVATLLTGRGFQSIPYATT